MSSNSTSKKTIELFYSYSHADEKLRDELEKHLSLLKRQALITSWHDRKILPGNDWGHEIDNHQNSADIILMLVSADFLASDYCYDVEVKRALERHKAGEARVIPIILRPVDWSLAPFSTLQALPRDAKAVTTWDNLDEAFAEVSKGIRLVCEEIRKINYTVVQTPQVAALESLELFEVFKPAGVPIVTFVEPDNFSLLKLALAQPGRGVVIEGPSGIGKTTALRKAMEQLDLDKELSQIIMLTARRPEDVFRLSSLPKWHKGLVAVDDFHRLSTSLQEELIDYLKFLADSEAIDRKLVIIGIPQTGRKLIEISFDIALRVEICKLGKVKDETVLKMIEKGEKALNVKFGRKTDLARAASGSLNIAQLLCYQIAVQENVFKTQSLTKEIHSHVERAISQVMEQMSLKFGEVIRLFASLGGHQDRTGIELLQELAKSEDGFLSFYPLRDVRPELANGIDIFLKEKYIEGLYSKIPVSKNHILLDETTPALIIDDPQLLFYIKQTPSGRLFQSAGKIRPSVRNKIFISYSQADVSWFQRIRVHLRPLERVGAIEIWDDTMIQPGSMWKREIKEAMVSAKVALLLISPDYLASDFISENELPPLLTAAAAEGTLVLPLFVGPSRFLDTPLGQFQAINDPSKPLVSMTKNQQEELFVKIATTIEGVLS